MGTSFMKKAKGNNKGFTLVELIVAITILALVVIPMSRLFTASTRMNMVSKRRMNAITLAEDTMEGIKANTIDKISWKFNYPGNFDLINTSLFANGADSGSIMQVTGFSTGDGAIDEADSGITTTDGGATYTFEPNTTGQYFYRLKNVDVQDEKEQYDALIKIDASPYMNSGDDIDPKINYNAAQLSEVATIKGKTNASYIQSEDKETRIQNDLALSCGEAIDESNMYRDMVINIKKVGATTEVSVDTDYRVKVGGVQVANYSDSVPKYAGTEGPIENFFFFYLPNYNSKSGDIHDNIVINNKDSVPVNVYIVKQETEPAASLQISETTYRVNVSDVEASFSGPFGTKILTNIDYNMASAYLNSVSPDINQGKFLIKTSMTQASGTEAKDLIVSDLADTRSQLRYFDVDIQIYKSDDLDGDVIYELKGSTME